MGLFGPKFKNDDKLFLSLKDFYETIGKLLTEDKYISRKEYIRFCNDKANDFDNVITLRNNNTLNYWCKTTKSDPSLIDKFIYSYQNIQSIIEKHNKQFMERHLAKDKDYLDKILKDDDPNIILDEDQRNVVLNDEDHVLVVAGAGAGKTTTLEAKAKYLVDKQHVDPKRIIVVSFTKKATKELQERFDKIKVPAVISTFHSPLERDVMDFLLQKKQPLIYVLPAHMYKRVPLRFKEALNDGRLLFISITSESVRRTSSNISFRANKYILSIASEAVFASIAPASSTEKLYNSCNIQKIKLDK